MEVCDDDDGALFLTPRARREGSNKQGKENRKWGHHTHLH